MEFLSPLRYPGGKAKVADFLDPDHLLFLCRIHVRPGAHLSYQRDPGILQGYGTDRQHLPAVRHVADPDYVQRAAIPRQRSDDGSDDPEAEPVLLYCGGIP